MTSLHHKFSRARRASLQALCALGAAAIAPARAQAFPSRQIRIVPFGTAGGPVDTLARVYAEHLRQRWGQPVIVEPRPGASGIIAAEFVAKSPPDGYTVMLTLPTTHVNNAILNPNLPYDPIKDFQPLSILSRGAPAIVARVDAPYGDVKSFIEFAHKQPKGLTYGTWGLGTMPHLFGALLSRQSGVNLIHIPYKSESMAHIDLLGGTLDFAWANAATARRHIQAGKMKAFATAGTRRSLALPDVRTFGEQGWKGFDIDSWFGVFAPAGLPHPVLDAWASALREITALPDVANRIVEMGHRPVGSTPAEFAEQLKADFPPIRALIQAAGVTWG